MAKEQLTPIEQAIHELQSLETELQDNAPMAARVQAIVSLLEADEEQWVSSAEATAILEAYSVQVVENWVRMGFLRGRRTTDGQLMVRRADLLRERAVDEAVAGSWDDREITADEYALLREGSGQELPEEVRAVLAQFMPDAKAQSPK